MIKDSTQALKTSKKLLSYTKKGPGRRHNLECSQRLSKKEEPWFNKLGRKAYRGTVGLAVIK